MGEFQRSSAGLWRIVIASAALLAVPLTVAVHALKKPRIDAGFNNLNTDEHKWTGMKNPNGKSVFHLRSPVAKTPLSAATAFANCVLVMVSGGVKLMTFACPPSGRRMKPR